MTAVARALAEIAAALDERGRRWALVGGLAVSCHVDPRFTRDIDIVVVVDDDSDAESDDTRLQDAIDLRAAARRDSRRFAGSEIQHRAHPTARLPPGARLGRPVTAVSE